MVVYYFYKKKCTNKHISWASKCTNTCCKCMKKDEFQIEVHSFDIGICQHILSVEAEYYF